MQLLFLRKICTICSYSACIVQCFEYAREIQSSLWLHGACAAGSMFFHGSVRPSLETMTQGTRATPWSWKNWKQRRCHPSWVLRHLRHRAWPSARCCKEVDRECILHKAELYGTLWQNLQEIRRSVEWPRPDTISCKNMRSRRTIHGQAFTPKRKKGRSWNKSVSKDAGFKHTDFERFQRLRAEALPGAAKRSAQKWDTPRLCAEDMLTHCKTKVFSKSSKECKAAKNSKQKSQTTLKKSSVNLKKL